jgi:hypothetical protein
LYKIEPTSTDNSKTVQQHSLETSQISKIEDTKPSSDHPKSIPHKILTLESSQDNIINTLEYNGIYSSKAEDGRKGRQSVRRNKQVHKNASEQLIGQRNTPGIDRELRMPNIGVDSRQNVYQNLNDINGLKETRNSSLVLINSNNHLQGKSRSRPKQRQTKLIDGSEKVNSILKILEKK